MASQSLHDTSSAPHEALLEMSSAAVEELDEDDPITPFPEPPHTLRLVRSQEPSEPIQAHSRNEKEKTQSDSSESILESLDGAALIDLADNLLKRKEGSHQQFYELPPFNSLMSFEPEQSSSGLTVLQHRPSVPSALHPVTPASLSEPPSGRPDVTPELMDTGTELSQDCIELHIQAVEQKWKYRMDQLKYDLAASNTRESKQQKTLHDIGLRQMTKERDENLEECSILRKSLHEMNEQLMTITAQNAEMKLEIQRFENAQERKVEAQSRALQQAEEKATKANQARNELANLLRSTEKELNLCKLELTASEKRFSNELEGQKHDFNLKMESDNVEMASLKRAIQEAQLREPNLSAAESRRLNDEIVSSARDKETMSRTIAVLKKVVCDLHNAGKEQIRQCQITVEEDRESHAMKMKGLQEKLGRVETEYARLKSETEKAEMKNDELRHWATQVRRLLGNTMQQS